MRIAVVGAGSWGTAVAVVAAQGGAPVRLLCRSAERAAQIGAERRNRPYLPDIALPSSVEVGAMGDRGALDGIELVVLAVPSRSVGEVGAWLGPRLPRGGGVLSLTKGLDPVSGQRLSQSWAQALPPGTSLCVLTGPNHAEEVADGQPAAAVVAGCQDLGRRVQERLSGNTLRLYLNDDLVGVELCGAAKNVIALAAGMSDGVGFGDNCKAALLTRGLAEMTRLGMACGARAATFRGLAGMGDLVATCTSRHSRNRRAGELLAMGFGADQVERELGQVAEGLWTVRHLLTLAAQVGVELPISAEVAEVTYRGRPVQASLDALMSRAPAAEE